MAQLRLHLHSFIHQDECERVPLFCFPCTGQPPLEPLLSDSVPVQLQTPLQRLTNYITVVCLQATAHLNVCLELRAQRKKRPAKVPSLLSDADALCQEITGKVTQAGVRLAIGEALQKTRTQFFASSALRDVSTATLRHLCMGALVDGYRIHMRLMEDLEHLAERVGVVLTLGTLEKLEFLRSIESHFHITEVCEHCVRSRASSVTKAAVRELYLQLLSVKHHVTPTQAQELVPGFTYDHIQSLDAVLELLDSPQPVHDAEILQFRQRLSRLKAPPQRLRPRLSTTFVARLQKRLRRP